MNKQKFCEAEERRLNWLINFKLPNYWKKIGWGILVVSLALILSTKFIDGDFDLLKSILKKAMLIGLLIVTISREKIEDEFIENLRSKSFSLAFIFGVIYVLAQPVVNYIVSLILQSEKANYEDLGDFQILWFLLVVYLTAFWSLKRRNA
ncbi:hypothetical protein [Aequorivita antarctica]|uniref:Uncharacterized protein n=1 Tax=Aequorivita antarctica TaxID=153266 RepID=A0A5C6Z354_9FLAO|nr:hypothetical protein [Aequorivita antarctica]TXD74300.1 hypothetical protein ESU54_03345 [Aequorivita antarctica]SRX73645.1 hypothetical protein AEQU3_01077 [Aequorivita antarctica]